MSVVRHVSRLLTTDLFIERDGILALMQLRGHLIEGELRDFGPLRDCPPLTVLPDFVVDCRHQVLHPIRRIHMPGLLEVRVQPRPEVGLAVQSVQVGDLGP